MSTPIINTAKGLANINTGLIQRDMAKTISLLKPAETPLLTMLKSKIGSRVANSYKIEWIEDSLMNRWVGAAAQVLVGAGSFSVGAGQGAVIAVNDMLLNTVTNERLLVTAVAGDALTVTRGYGDSAPAQIETTHKLLVMGNVIMQGAGSPAEKSNNPSIQYNYTQIIRTPFSVTNTLEATRLYGGSTLEHLHMKKGIDHAMSIEQMLWFGSRNIDTSGAQPVTSCAGVLQFLEGTANVTSKALASAVIDDLYAWAEKLFAYGSSTKALVCGNSMLGFIDKLAREHVNLLQSDNDKTFGLDIQNLRTPYGTLKLMRHPMFVNGLAGHAFGLDMEELEYRPLVGRDTSLKENIQNNDEDGRRDEYLTEGTLEFRHPEKHGAFILTA